MNTSLSDANTHVLRTKQILVQFTQWLTSKTMRYPMWIRSLFSIFAWFSISTLQTFTCVKDLRMQIGVCVRVCAFLKEREREEKERVGGQICVNRSSRRCGILVYSLGALCTRLHSEWKCRCQPSHGQVLPVYGFKATASAQAGLLSN